MRAKVAAKIGRSRSAAAPLIHPDATVGLGNDFADGVVLFAGARVTTNVTLRRHVHLNQNATVGHDSELGDFVQVNPLAAVSGDCRLGERVLIGTTAAVLQGLSLGARATIGAGEVRQEFNVTYYGQIVGGTLAVSDESTDVEFIDPANFDRISIHDTVRLRLRHHAEHSVTPYLG